MKETVSKFIPTFPEYDPIVGCSELFPDLPDNKEFTTGKVYEPFKTVKNHSRKPIDHLDTVENGQNSRNVNLAPGTHLGAEG